MADKVFEKEKIFVSDMAEGLKGSEIIKLATEIKDLIAEGNEISNFTIGDFDPSLFPIPEPLKAEIIRALENNVTNYPAANGEANLRKAVSDFLVEYFHLSYSAEEILIAGGARPLIFAIFKTLVNPGEKVVFPVPSWNNNHYIYLSEAIGVPVEVFPENNFMLTADLLEPHIQDASLLTLCSPQNPTGTIFTREQLGEICDLVIRENKRRGDSSKPLYVMFDQIYALLCFGDEQHIDPVSLREEMKDYTIYVDGISKAFAATGVRVGWAFGPEVVINKMKSILGHVGAWAPKAEQKATAIFLNNSQQVQEYLKGFKDYLYESLWKFYQGFRDLKDKGFPIEAIKPQAAIYLTVKIDLRGKTTSGGTVLTSISDVNQYILKEAGLALVPFSAFGSSVDSPWFRLSVGTASIEQIPLVFNRLESALSKLK